MRFVHSQLARITHTIYGKVRQGNTVPDVEGSKSIYFTTVSVSYLLSQAFVHTTRLKDRRRLGDPNMLSWGQLFDYQQYKFFNFELLGVKYF